MKKTSAVIFIFVVLVWSAYCKSQKSNASVEVIDGVEFIHNTETPMYPNKTVSFVEDLSLSGEDKDGNIKNGIICKEKIHITGILCKETQIINRIQFSLIDLSLGVLR